MLHTQCFILFSFSCLIFKYVKVLPKQYSLINRRPDVFNGNSAYCECGKKNTFPSLITRIIGGREVLGDEFPWIAGIININESRLICGATIISDHYVITAAHCLRDGFTKNDVKVSIGTYACRLNKRTRSFPIEHIFLHPQYDKQTSFADIMLVKLHMKIIFNEFTRPICLPKIGLDVSTRFEGKSVSALGWGLSEHEATLTETCILRVVDLILFKKSECPTNILTLICAGYKLSPRGTCAGDSGGPLQILDKYSKYILIGITSNGIVCADVTYPDFYTDVTQMVPWILNIIKHHSLYCQH